MFCYQPVYSWQSLLSLWLCGDRTEFVLNDDVGLNWKRKEGVGSLYFVYYGVPFRVFCSCPDFRQVIEYFGYWLKSFFIFLITYLCFTHFNMLFCLLLILQIYRAGITFIYTVCLVGDG